MKQFKRATLIAFLSSIALLMVIFSGCENPTDVTTTFTAPGSAYLVGFIHGIVRDAVTMQPITNVQIHYDAGNGYQTVTTNSQGYYSIDYLDIGTYDLVCTIADTDYVGSSLQVVVSFETGPDDTVYVGNGTYYLYFAEDILLYPRTSGLTGQVFAVVDAENSPPAQGAVVEADFSDWMVYPALYTTTVNSSGTFSFANLPSTPNVDIRVLPFTYEGIDFGSEVRNNIALENSASVSMAAILLDPVAIAPVVISNNFVAGNVPLDQNLILTFSVEMNPNETEVTLTGSSGVIPCYLSWDASYLTLTIDPTLLFIPDFQYRLDIASQSAAGAPYTHTFLFNTLAGIEVFTSNIYEYEGIERHDFGINESITITFTIAADPNNPNNGFHLTQLPALPIAVAPLWSSDSTQVTITPTAFLLHDTHYRVDVTVYSTMPNDHVDWNGQFWTAP